MGAGCRCSIKKVGGVVGGVGLFKKGVAAQDEQEEGWFRLFHLRLLRVHQPPRTPLCTR